MLFAELEKKNSHHFTVKQREKYKKAAGSLGIYIFKANDSNKGQNVTSVKLSVPSAYAVKSNLKDVFFASLAGRGNPPTFETLPDDPIVAFKRLSYNAYGNVFYIPELKAGTVIKDFNNGYLVY